MNEQTALNVFRAEIKQAGISFGKVEALVTAGWTLPMVREAADIAKIHRARFAYIARMEQRGIPLPVIGELIEFKREHPELTLPLLWKCWGICTEQATTEPAREFFASFLAAAGDLFEEARSMMKSEVTKSPSFIFGRLLEYVLGPVSGDIEAVYLEMIDDPRGLLRRIMTASRHGQEPLPQGTVIRGNPYDGVRINLVDLDDGDDDEA